MQDNLGLFDNSVGVKRIAMEKKVTMYFTDLHCTFRETFNAKDKTFVEFEHKQFFRLSQLG